MNLNPYFLLEDGPDPKICKDQLRRAASLCFASLKLASSLKHETLPPDSFKGNPLCMDQFKVLFGSSRQPKVRHTSDSCDEVHVYSDSIHDTGHIAVDEADILDILQACQQHASQANDTETTREAIGVFTSLPRSDWAVARQEMCLSESNETALHVIDSALFVLVLDDFEGLDIHKSAANMLHGTNEMSEDGNLQIGTCLNRWYDKLQLIVCEDGTCGCNFEHSAIDGHTALRFVSDAYAETVISFAESIVDLIHGRGRIAHVVDAVIERAATCLDESGTPLLDVFPKKLTFDLTESILKKIYHAETRLCDDLVGSDTYVLEFKRYGKKLIIGNKLSPDSFVQMSILLAYYKLYGKVVCMYEPVLTKAFYHGRTEAMRSLTPEAKKLCETWCNEKASPSDKLEALKNATIEHSRQVRDAAKGKGVDRHLFGLKSIAERKGMGVPAFFQSKAWTMLNHTVLSTSNCGNPALRLFGFGPVVPDGFGVGYIIKDNGLSYSVSSKHRQTERYVRSLDTTLQEMQQLLQQLSSIEVKVSQSNSVLSFPRTAERECGYRDMWGESDAAHPIQTDSEQNTSVQSLRLGSQYFSQVREKSVALVDLRNTQE